jgi:hypothetical protein
VELSDGATAEHAANIVAENMCSQCDAEGRQCTVLQEIADHRKSDKAVALEELTGNRTATKGWDLKVEWKDGTTSWVPLKDLKASNPAEVAEHAIGNGIHEEPAFRWWAPHVLRKRERILKKVKSRHWKTAHKFGIELPHSVERALQTDQETSTTFWKDAIEKEMRKVTPPDR